MHHNVHVGQGIVPPGFITEDIVVEEADIEELFPQILPEIEVEIRPADVANEEALQAQMAQFPP